MEKHILSKMDSKIYYIPKSKGILVTSDFIEIKRRMDVGIDPQIEYIPISIREFEKYPFKGIGFDKIEDHDFKKIEAIVSNYKLETIAFHDTNVNLSEMTFDVNHLIIGNNSKINLFDKNFRNLEQITFLSVKTFKGKILNKIESVEKLIVWYENKKSNEIVSMFPNLKEFYIYNGSIVELDLEKNPLLEILELYRCIKLEKVILNSFTKLKKVIVESCNRLDRSFI